jgi:hypothetical protein
MMRWIIACSSCSLPPPLAILAVLLVSVRSTAPAPGIDSGLAGRYNPEKDLATQNLATPLVKDTFQVWQRSWAVIRFKVGLSFSSRLPHLFPL